MNADDLYELWLSRVTDMELLAELLSIAHDADAVEDRFYRELEFGTGGLRGVLGAGTNRMNVLTVGKATQGYADYLHRHFERPSVAISYDSRRNSALFARCAACVFAANGIAVHLYSRLMPTPALSFAVRELGCSGGIMITASHNPAKYNGYKVYGADGCQITTEAAAEIQAAINAVDLFTQVRTGEYDDFAAQGLITLIPESVTDRYLQAVACCSLADPALRRELALVYTPLNGAGISVVPELLRRQGFTNLVVPEAQREPNGDFPTCPYPNPEIREALELGLETARSIGSDLVLATDPDCDRVGCAVRDGDDYRLISGNEMGCLLLDYVCRRRLALGNMPEHPVAIKTIVTTPMAAGIAEAYGVELRNVLTGFKFIGEQIGCLEAEGREGDYIFGFEESYGYLSGSYVRDKDGANAALLICEMVCDYAAAGISLSQALDALYERFGFYETQLLSYAFEGSAGFERMQALMSGLRAQPPAALAGQSVLSCTDYLHGDTGLPASDVLRYTLACGEAVVRPSGTEPKLKVYLTVCADRPAESRRLCEQLKEHFDLWAR